MASRGGGNSRNQSNRRSSTSNRSSGRRSTGSRRAVQESAISQEVVLIVLFAVCILLFLCNFGVIGVVGNAISGVLFGVFGLLAYVFPIVLFVGILFYLSNQGNLDAGIKMGSAGLLLLVLSVVFELLGKNAASMEKYSLAEIYAFSSTHKLSGGIIGGSVTYFLVNLLGVFGTILIVVVLSVILFVMITGRSFVGGVQDQGRRAMEAGRRKARESAEINQVRRQERAQLREENLVRRERERREELERRQAAVEKRREEFAREKELQEQEDEERKQRLKQNGIMTNTLLTRDAADNAEVTTANTAAGMPGRESKEPVIRGNFGSREETESSRSDEVIREDENETTGREGGSLGFELPSYLETRRGFKQAREEADAKKAAREAEAVRKNVIPSLDAIPAVDASRIDPTEEPDDSELFGSGAVSVTPGDERSSVFDPLPANFHKTDVYQDMQPMSPSRLRSHPRTVGYEDFVLGGTAEDKGSFDAAETIADAVTAGVAAGAAAAASISAVQGISVAARTAQSGTVPSGNAPEPVIRTGGKIHIQQTPHVETAADVQKKDIVQEPLQESAASAYEDAEPEVSFFPEEEEPIPAESVIPTIGTHMERVPISIEEDEEYEFDELPWESQDLSDPRPIRSQQEDETRLDHRPKAIPAKHDPHDIEQVMRESSNGRLRASEVSVFAEKRDANPAAAGSKSFTTPGMDTAPKPKPQPPQRPYVLPSTDLLSVMKNTGNPDAVRELKETAEKLQRTLEVFGVRVTITEISQGPAVTRYEMLPEQGVKVSKILGLADDIKLNLAATDVRIEAPIPGKAAIGIEVPNKENTPVGLRELLESDEFKNFNSKIAFAVGKDISGKVIVSDIGKMPHMLIAGATGSGKSVCINTLIMSILYKAKPDEVKLILIDPKVVELSVYNGIPHLLIPVVTDPKQASGALKWAVAEMTDRYQKFADMNVRDFKGYNKKVEEAIANGEPNPPSKIPYIVVIVDELADLMMVAPGEVEESICRLAQLARAAGIHLVIATQRPSVNVITGLIKANMPSRVAFSVTSGVDSRTILDMVGAEKLLGKGDMLYYPQGYPKPVRIQGAFVSDNEVSDVVGFLKDQVMGNVIYDDQVMNRVKSGGGAAGASQEDSEERDEYFEKAARFIVEKDKASIGMLQRLLKVGFNRAARIMDQLAEAGVVGEEEGTKPRKILMTEEQLEQYLEEYV